MNTMAYPLDWPPMWPRTEQRRLSQFQTSLHQARLGLYDELRLLGARDVIISTNIPLRQDGQFRASFTGRLDDPGVAVYFTLDGEERVIPCDRWVYIEDNVQAIRKTVEALRGLERWGASEMMHAAFQGFAALPAGGGDSPDAWWTVLGVSPDATWGEVLTAMRTLFRTHHPDNGGDPEQFHRIQAAYQQAREARRS